MKPLFGFNKTTNEEAYSAKLVVKTLDAELEKEYNETATMAYNINKKSQNKFGRIGNYSLWAAVILVFVGILPIINSDILTTIKSNMWYFIIAGVLLLVGIVCKILEKVIKPSKKLQEDAKWIQEKISEWEVKRDEYFDFPAKKNLVDILVPYYTVKNGVMKDRNPLGINVNIVALFFDDDENLYISDNLSVYQIPKANVKDIIQMEGKTPFMYWNKTEPYTSDKYNQYNIKKNNTGYYTTNGRTRIVTEFDEIEYYFDILPFDYEIVYNSLNIYKGEE